MSLHNRKMCCTQTAPNGVINRETIFHFTQAGEVVEARYAGGRIRAGYLVGLVKHNELVFRYCQLSDHAQLDGGSSRCQLEEAADGRMRIIESFAWESQAGSGVNILEECD